MSGKRLLALGVAALLALGLISCGKDGQEGSWPSGDSSQGASEGNPSSGISGETAGEGASAGNGEESLVFSYEELELPEEGDYQEVLGGGFGKGQICAVAKVTLEPDLSEEISLPVSELPEPEEVFRLYLFSEEGVSTGSCTLEKLEGENPRLERIVIGEDGAVYAVREAGYRERPGETGNGAADNGAENAGESGSGAAQAGGSGNGDFDSAGEEDSARLVQRKDVVCWNLDGSLRWKADVLTGQASEEAGREVMPWNEYCMIKDMKAGADGRFYLLWDHWFEGEDGMLRHLHLSILGEDGELLSSEELEDVPYDLLEDGYLRSDGSLILFCYGEDGTGRDRYDYDPGPGVTSGPEKLPEAYAYGVGPLWESPAKKEPEGLAGTQQGKVGSGGVQQESEGADGESPESLWVRRTQEGLCLCDLETGEERPFLNFLESDLPYEMRESLENLCFLTEDRFVASYRDMLGNTGFGLFTRMDPETLQARKTLTLGCFYLEKSTYERIRAFNRSNEKYRFVVKDYSEFDEAESGGFRNQPGLSQLDRDILAGDMPDVLVVQGMDVEKYEDKGVFADIGALIRQDEELSQKNFLENVWDAYTVEGVLQYVVPKFYITTFAAGASQAEAWAGSGNPASDAGNSAAEDAGRAGSGSSASRSAGGTGNGAGAASGAGNSGTEASGQAGNGTGVASTPAWSMDDFLECMARSPEGTLPYKDVSRRNFLWNVLKYDGSRYIDPATGKCEFDSEDFVKVLEFAQTLPEAEAYEEWWGEDYGGYRDGSILLRETELRTLDRYHVGELEYIFGGPVEYVGFPSERGGGSLVTGEGLMVLSAASENLEGSWEFARYYLTDEYQETLMDNVYLSVNEDLVRQMIWQMAERPYYIADEEGNRVYYDYEYWYGDDQVLQQPYTEEECEKLFAFVKSVNWAETIDQEVYQLIMEEAEAFFLGEKSAAETADVIQGRAAILVSERQ